MDKLNGISETLFIPLAGRIYASERFPELFYDKRLYELRIKLPEIEPDFPKQNEYTYLASACRSFNLDNEVKQFIKRFPEGTVVNLGAGLETSFFRVDNGKISWFDLDLPEVIELRKKFFDETDRYKFIPGSIFDFSWMEKIISTNPKAILIVASGLLYYFTKDSIINLICVMKNNFKVCELVFDAVCKNGLKRSNRFVKKSGNSEATMYFYVNDAVKFFDKIPCNIQSVDSYPFYEKFLKISGKKCSLKTQLIMKISDLFNMVKIIRAKLN